MTQVRAGWRRAGLVAAGGWLLLSAAAARAQTPVPWAVKDAAIRAEVKLKEAPGDPDTGTEIAVPDLGLTKPDAGGYALMDAAGKPLPVAVVWQGVGRETRLLARDLQPAQTYYLYIGGKPGASWNPKTSLLLETRRETGSRSEILGSFGSLQSAWSRASAQSWGAGFVEKIFAGGNPYGEPTYYLSHYSGYLAPTGTDVELFTNSADASFVLINDQPFTDWTGSPSTNVFVKGVRGKKLPASAVPVKIDYYQAKGEGALPPNMSLGWRKGSGPLEIVPESAFLHPGNSQVGRYVAQDGSPVPAPQARFLTYLGDGGGYLYEVKCSVRPASVENATVEWHFDDGAILSGTEITRIMSGTPGTQNVAVIAQRGAASRRTTLRIGFYGPPPREVEHKRGNDRYVEMLMQLDPTKLDAAMLAAALPVLFDFGMDAQSAAYADAWLALNPEIKDPLWLPAYIARERERAQIDPKKAAAEVAANTAARQYYDQALDVLELDLLVFAAHDLASLPRVQQLAFNLGPDKGKLGEIRVGDLYRLNGDLNHAAERYRAAQPPDPLNGRRLPAEDQANALTVEDLIGAGAREEAMDKLAKWELLHPSAKLTTNYLVLRARALTLFGRWRESLAELNAFIAMQADSAYEIDADFYRARALYELGDKDQARKLWRQIASKYPKSDLAKPSLEWADKS